MIYVLVTGASRGIGRDLTLKLLKDGCTVLAISRSIDGLSSLEEKARSIGMETNLIIQEADISKTEDLKKVFDTLETKFDYLNVLINNAGLLINKPISDLEIEDFDAIYGTNVKAPFILIKRSLDYLKKAPWSHVVNISSVGGVTGSTKFPGLSLYSSSKGALNILGEVLAEELTNDGVSVNNLALGAVQTEMLEAAFPGYEAPIDSESMANYIAHFALNNWKYINGKTISVNLSNP